MVFFFSWFPVCCSCGVEHPQVNVLHRLQFSILNLFACLHGLCVFFQILDLQEAIRFSILDVDLVEHMRLTNDVNDSGFIFFQNDVEFVLSADKLPQFVVHFFVVHFHARHEHGSFTDFFLAGEAFRQFLFL